MCKHITAQYQRCVGTTSLPCKINKLKRILICSIENHTKKYILKINKIAFAIFEAMLKVENDLYKGK